jgi:hypothetical protein
MLEPKQPPTHPRSAGGAGWSGFATSSPVLLLAVEPIPAEVREQFLIAAVTAFVLAGPGTDADRSADRAAGGGGVAAIGWNTVSGSDCNPTKP